MSTRKRYLNNQEDMAKYLRSCKKRYENMFILVEGPEHSEDRYVLKDVKVYKNNRFRFTWKYLDSIDDTFNTFDTNEDDLGLYGPLWFMESTKNERFYYYTISAFSLEVQEL